MAWSADRTEWLPPSLCSTGIETALLALGTSAAAAAPEVGAAAILPASSFALAPVAADVGLGLGAATTTAAGALPAAAGGLPGLGTLGTIASIGGTGASFLGSQQQAQAAKDAAASQATALRLKAAADKVDANTQAGYYQRQALVDRRKEQLLLSRQQAVAAAGGGYATDPSNLTLAQDVAGQGEYNALSNLAAGQTREAALNYQADIDKYQAGRYDKAAGMASTAGLYSGAGTLFSGLGTLTSNLQRERYYGRGGGYGSGGLFG